MSTLEERDDLKLMTLDELHGIFTDYEMRTGQDRPSKREAAFKALSKNNIRGNLRSKMGLLRKILK